MIDNNLRNCREEMEMTHKKLGNIIGVCKSRISNWETGYDPITLHRLVKFCNLYNYSLDYVCELIRKNIENGKYIKLDQKKIGKRLKKLRKYLKISQAKFAKKCGIVGTIYNHYETGYSLVCMLMPYVRHIKYQWIG